MKKLFFLFLLLLTSNIFAISKTSHSTPPSIEFDNQPFYTSGPLFTNGYSNTKPGHFSTQLYFLALHVYGIHDNSGNVVRLPINIQTMTFSLNFGICNWLDFNISPTWEWNQFRSHYGNDFQDSTASIGIQILNDNKESSWPGIRLIIQELFPLGRYQNLNPHRMGVDISGYGIWDTAIGIGIGKTVYYMRNHPITWRLYMNYDIPSNVRIHNFNSWGGGYGCNGKINPGHLFNLFAAFEFNLSPNWVIAWDFCYFQNTHDTFKGYVGTRTNGGRTLGSLDLVRTEGWEMCPQLEYNFDEHWGIEAGVYFSTKGRYTFNFMGGVISAGYNY